MSVELDATQKEIYESLGLIDKVAIINGQVSPRKVMLLTVAADHRWIDGGNIAKFARDVKGLLEEPAMLWMESEINNV